jgi:BolA protein
MSDTPASAAPSYRRRIEMKLTQRLAPSRLEIEDESPRHAGHAGHRAEGETHFRVIIVSSAFAGLGRVQRQRLVYEALRDELAERVHALAMTTLTPDEAASAPG